MHIGTIFLWDAKGSSKKCIVPPSACSSFPHATPATYEEVGGIKEYDTNQARTFADKGEHTLYDGMPIDNGDNPFLDLGRASVRNNNKQESKIKTFTDNYGAENTWELILSTDQVVRQNGLKS